MSDTERKNLGIASSVPNSSTPPTGSVEKPPEPAEASTPSINYTKSSVEHLLRLAKEVSGKSKNAKAVNAACNCYSQIYKFLRLNVDLQKIAASGKKMRKEIEPAPEEVTHAEVTRLEDSKVAQVKAALERFDGNKTHAAQALGISIRSLRNWVQERDELADYRIDPPERQIPPGQVFGTE